MNDRGAWRKRKRCSRSRREYRDALNLAESYKAEMIPRAKESYELSAKNFQAMQAAYPLVLAAQRTLFELEREYVPRQAAAQLDGLVTAADMSQ